MANVLSTDKKIAVIGALAEGSSIRSIERITGVHRDTIMRLGVKVGEGCTALMDAKMRNLSCKRLEMDEIWGFVGKKDRNVKMGDSNGGIVLNISETGISVQAAAVLDPSEPVTLSLEIPRVRNRVEVKGEIAWLSPSKKEAGIRFIDLPESTLKQIQKWMAREASPEQFEDETDPVGEPQEVPVAAAAVKAAVESAPMEATAEAVEEIAGIEAVPDEDGGVRELNEANILSADEIKKLASEPNAVRRTTVAVSEEEVQEI